MPVFTDALIGDTLHLSTEEFGAYCLLLFATWRNNGKALPDDDASLARICRVPEKRWVKTVRPTLSRFFNIDDGCWHQKRLEKEWEFVQRRAETSRRNGPLGGRPPRNPTETREKPTGFSNENPEGTQTEPTHTHTHKQLASKLIPDSLPKDWAELAAAERAKAGLPEVDLAAEWGRFIRKIGTTPTEDRWLGWAMKARIAAADSAPGKPKNGAGILPEEPWPQRCRAWAKGHRWGPGHGPAPDEPGCWAPADLVSDALHRRAEARKTMTERTPA